MKFEFLACDKLFLVISANKKVELISSSLRRMDIADEKADLVCYNLKSEGLLTKNECGVKEGALQNDCAAGR